MTDTLRVLVVNDSATARAALRLALERSPGIELVAAIADGAAAVDAVLRHRPDVVLMDVVMPECDGYEATRAIMQRCPTPVVMVTARVDARDEEVVLRALGAGALAITTVPPPNGHRDHPVKMAALVQLIRTMARANVGRARDGLGPSGAERPAPAPHPPRPTYPPAMQAAATPPPPAPASAYPPPQPYPAPPQATTQPNGEPIVRPPMPMPLSDRY